MLQVPVASVDRTSRGSKGSKVSRGSETPQVAPPHLSSR